MITECKDTTYLNTRKHLMFDSNAAVGKSAVKPID